MKKIFYLIFLFSISLCKLVGDQINQAKYDLSHLTQPKHQRIVGPIQDDEALFLYSIIRGCRLSRILEIGGLKGYSARNFLQAISFDDNGIVYTCEICDERKLRGGLAKNHKVIIKDVKYLTSEDLDNLPIDMIFFDCHDMSQMDLFHRLVHDKLITDKTIIALHDTNLHYKPYGVILDKKYIPEEDGYIVCTEERSMVNMFKDLGYDIFSISTDKSKHSPKFPFRHGITVCQKFKKLQF